MKDINRIALDAKNQTAYAQGLTSHQKNAILMGMADALDAHTDKILQANSLDMDRGREEGMTKALLDRLYLDEDRVRGMTEGLRALCSLKDPIGGFSGVWTNDVGLSIGRMAVPLGVVLMIYEARPNVTVDAAGLCLKTGNVAILRGSRSALESNKALMGVLRQSLKDLGHPEDLLQLVEDTRYDSLHALLKRRDAIDLVIPRGGAGLIQSVVEESTIPVIETGVGNCHLYVDGSAKLDQALAILLNGKLQRPGVCNALETLLVDQAVAQSFLPQALEALLEAGVSVRGCEKTQAFDDRVQAVTEEDYATEYHDMALAVRVVDDLGQAISHIGQYGTKHTETFVGEDFAKVQTFMKEVDAACVNINASSRFSDGFQYGFGAEIGISTQKIHARGPMGLDVLTSYKYVVVGQGHVRA